MEILYLASAFPKPSEGSTIYTDLAQELNIQHNITMLVTDHKIQFGKIKKTQERNLVVYRIGILKYYDVGFIRKGISAITQSRIIRMAIKTLRLEKRFDLLLYSSPPLLNSKLINYIKNTYNCKSYLMLKDIFPQNAVDLNIFKKRSLIHRYFTKLERNFYKSSDIIGCMSPANMKYICSENKMVCDKLRYFPNTKKLKENIEKDPAGINLLNKYQVVLNKKIILFGGNMGKPQNISLLSRIIAHFKDNSDIYFLLIGRGQEKIIEQQIEEMNLSNVSLISNIHRDKYELILPFVDIGLILLHEDFTIPNFPSRILSYMEYSKPVFAATDKHTDIKDLIIDNNFGYWADASNFELVAKGLEEMINSSNLEELEFNARKCIENNFDVSKSVTLLEKHYKELI